MYLLYITITLRMGLRHALPDGLRSKYGVSRRIFTRCITAPFLMRTVPFVETCSTVYGPSLGADIFRTLAGLYPLLYMYVGSVFDSPVHWTDLSVLAFLN